MILKNRIDRSFGPTGSASGWLLFAVGIIALYQSFFALILLVLGAFMSFTSSITYIDSANKKIKFANCYFGILTFGKWMLLSSDMKLGIKATKQGFRIFSRSNRSLNIEVKDYRIVLYRHDAEPIGPIQKFETITAAEAGLRHIAEQLGLERL